MARIGIHPHPHTAPRWASKSLRAARTIEGMCERHWPFAAYTLLTLGSAAYVLAQLVRI